MGVERPNGHTPPSMCPVIVAASSGASIVAFPPSTALTFLLSSRESPHTTTSTARPPTLNANVFAICAARMPQAADSVCVWLLAGSSTISRSGADLARNARTDSALIARPPLRCCATCRPRRSSPRSCRRDRRPGSCRACREDHVTREQRDVAAAVAQDLLRREDEL